MSRGHDWKNACDSQVVSAKFNKTDGKVSLLKHWRLR